MIAGSSVRIYYVNKDVKEPIEKEYRIGEKVAYGDDYLDADFSNIKGYSISVNNAEVLSASELYKKYLPDYQVPNETKNDWFYVLKVTFYNDDNDEGNSTGISLYFCPIVTKNDMCYCNGDMVQMIDKDLPSTTFALHKGTEREVTLVYEFDYRYYNRKKFDNEDYKLMITQYPDRKLINLK